VPESAYADPAVPRKASLHTASKPLLWLLLLTYAIARCLQLVEVPVPRLPILLVVILHVVPAALFAWIHGGITYGRRGILVFTVLCLGVGSAFESLSLRTGFPFGHYRFTDVMGPKILELPVLLALAYVGMGYISWVLATLIVGATRFEAARGRLLELSLVASFIMVAWDLAMDPVWATIDRAWIWRDGGAFFGVPVSNYLGWFLTVFTFYLLFAVYLRRFPTQTALAGKQSWRLPILFYGVSALGNLLLAVPRGSFWVADATGRAWRSADIVDSCALISLFVMLPFAVLAWIRLREVDLPLA